MTDRLMAFLGIFLLAAFCALLVSYVGRIDLGIVVGICVFMGAFDLLYYSFSGRDKNGSNGRPL